MTAAQSSGPIPDQVLADRARRGDQQAFEELHRRLAPSAWRLALAVTRDPRLAAGAVAAAFSATFASAPTAPRLQGVHAHLLAGVRHAASDPALAPVELGELQVLSSGPVGAAFASLPERWRSALWLVDVEGLAIVDAAVALAVPADAVAPLVERARAGLEEQVISADADAALTDTCHRTLDRLAEYSAGHLAARDAARVRRHLDACAACREVLTELDDLTPSLRGLALAVPVALAATSTAEWRAGLVRRTGPLHITLPSGRPLPVWAERTVAGAAAAVIALGIASAVLVAGRGGRVRDDRLARSAPAEAPLGGADGESAVGGTSGLTGALEGSGSSSGTSTTSTTVAGAADVLDRVLPGAGSVVTAPLAPSAPTVTEPAPTEPTAPTEPAPEPAAEPVAEVTIGLGDVAVVVGDECTGIDLAGTVLGCDPETSGEPLEVSTGGSLLPPLGL